VGHRFDRFSVALPAEQPDEFKAASAVGEVKLEPPARNLVERAVYVARDLLLVRAGHGSPRVDSGT
jgi:hypothetical protein